MKTKFLLASFLIILLAGTLVFFVPPPRKPILATQGRRNARRDSLVARLKQTGKLFRAGDFKQSALLARQGSLEALGAGELQIAARFTGNLGSCRFALHRYREALQSYLEARTLAESVRDNATAGSLDLNISSLYAQLGQMDAATNAIDGAMARLTGPDRLKRLPALLTSLAALDADQERIPQALDLYRRAIAAAARAGDQDAYSLACNDLGYVYLEHGRFRLAENALLDAYRVRKLNHLRSVESSYRNLGMLRLKQGETRQASSLLDRAVALSALPGRLRPAWEVYYARGSVRLQEGRPQAALDDLRIATRLAGNWFRGAFPDDATRIGAENRIRKVHSALITAGNSLYFSTGRPDLARETFEAAEANRAASLRAAVMEPRDWRLRLPPEYWETLQKLETAETESLYSASSASLASAEQIRRLHGALIQWESRAGPETPLELPDLLERTRLRLHPDSAFLAFHLDTPDSYLWALSRDSLAVYRLPPASEIDDLVKQFCASIRRGDSNEPRLGSLLYQKLFGQLDSSFRNKPRWLLALDAELFSLPFAALREPSRAAHPVFLAERHSLQIVSSAGMLSSSNPERPRSTGPFVGVADPVYNTADPRWRQRRFAGGAGSFFGLITAFAAGSAPAGDLQLARLAGSAREVADCAAAWQAPRLPIFLEGAAASRERLRRALETRPAVLHFATHVVQSTVNSGAEARSGLIVLSLNQAGQHEVLSPVEVATWNLHGAVVSLSGCSSGSAEALPATGLVGLTRACLAAGARAVVASRWPTPDDTGALFLAFYRYLHDSPEAGPAVALQRAQIDMLRSGTWRLHPVYWAAYFVTGNQP